MCHAHGDQDQSRRAGAVPGDRLPLRGDARVQGTPDRAPRPERGRAHGGPHAGLARPGVRPTPVRARSGAVLRHQQGAADAHSAPRPRRVGHRVPTRFVPEPCHRPDHRPLRARTRHVDREGESGRDVDAQRRVGLPWTSTRCPTTRCTTSATPRSAARRARACRSPASTSARAGGRACRDGSAGSSNVEPAACPRTVRRPGTVRGSRSAARPRPRGPRVRGRPPGGGDRPASPRRPGPGTASRSRSTTCLASRT